jgi:hypothetical protein
MSSTSNKNSRSEYELQVAGNQYIDQFRLYKYSTQPTTTLFAGNGLIMPHMGRDELSSHSIDHETYLFGIGSTNLVNPKAEFVPEIKNIKSLNIAKRTPLIMPQPSGFYNNNNNERPLIYR